MSSFDEKLGALLRAPVDQAQRQAEKVKACADVYAKSVEEQTLTRVARMLGDTTAREDGSAQALLDLLCSIAEIPGANELFLSLNPASKTLDDRAPPQEPVPRALAIVHAAPVAVDPPAPAAIHVVREYPLLWHASVGRPLLIVAGTSPQAQERIRWLEERVARHAWQEVKDSQGHVLDSTARRIREGSHCGVVLFAATTGGITSRTVRESCESSRTPIANANKPGVGTLGHALRTIELALQRAQESA